MRTLIALLIIYQARAQSMGYLDVIKLSANRLSTDFGSSILSAKETIMESAMAGAQMAEEGMNLAWDKVLTAKQGLVEGVSDV